MRESSILEMMLRKKTGLVLQNEGTLWLLFLRRFDSSFGRAKVPRLYETRSLARGAARPERLDEPSDRNPNGDSDNNLYIPSHLANTSSVPDPIANLPLASEATVIVRAGTRRSPT